MGLSARRALSAGVFWGTTARRRASLGQDPQLRPVPPRGDFVSKWREQTESAS